MTSNLLKPLSLLPAVTALMSVGSLITLPAAQPDPELEQFFQQYCYECHSATSADANNEFDLHTYVHSEFGLEGHPDILEDVLWVIEEQEMPPVKAKAHPSDKENTAAVDHLVGILTELQNASKDDPGNVVMARLNRGEYTNAMRDLSGGMPIKVSDVLPADSGAGEGFSNVGEALTMSTAQIERYLRAAKRVLNYALILPESGIEWYDEPLTFKDSPGELREHLITRMKEWHEGAANHWYHIYVRSLNRDHDMSHGVYWEAAWKLHHDPSQTPEAVAKTYEKGDVNPRLVGQWQELLSSELDPHFMEQHGYLVGRLAEWWQNLPAPDEVSDKQIREIIREKDQWFDNMTSSQFRWGPVYLTTLTGKDARRKNINQDPGEREYEITLLKPDPEDDDRKREVKNWTPPETIQLLVTDAWDTSQDDVIQWKEGEFRFGEGKSADWKSWSSVVDEMQTGSGEFFSWSGTPFNDETIVEVSNGTITVQAPALVQFPVPENATAFRVRAVTDPERGKNSSVQTVVLLDEEFDERDTRLFVRGGAPGVWGAEGSLGMEHFEKAANEQRGLVRRTHRAPDHEHPWYHYDVNALGNFTQRTGLGIEFVGGPWRVAPVIPVGISHMHYVNASMLQSEMPEDELKHISSLQEKLDQTLQLPHQRLVFFLREQGIDEYPEGVIPPDNAVAGLDAAAQSQFQELKQAALKTESVYRERALPIVHAFAEQAWRRHLEPTDVESMMSAYDIKRRTGGSYDAAVKAALKSVLMSPYFLFKHQRTLDSQQPYRLTAHEIADKLAFTLWGSIPDRELIDLAESGELLKEEVILEQTRRMLQDDRARGLATEFAGVWFKFRDFDADPDEKKFPDFNIRLHMAMEEEAIRFFTDLFQNDGSMRDILTADYKIVNERLASHYGIDGVEGDQWQRVSVPSQLQGGLLTMASILTKTSAPLRTSPVLRGTWLLEDVLGEHMPPPPPNVGQLSEGETNEKGMTIAEQLAVHRDRPECASCHNKIDPLGLAMENFDPIGQWRENVAKGQPVANEATTADGVPLDGMESLRNYLVDHKLDSFVHQFNRKFLGYALGRGVEVGDGPLLKEMEQAMIEDDYRFLPALEKVVTSKQFLYRRDPDPNAKVAGVESSPQP